MIRKKRTESSDRKIRDRKKPPAHSHDSSFANAQAESGTGSADESQKRKNKLFDRISLAYESVPLSAQLLSFVIVLLIFCGLIFGFIVCHLLEQHSIYEIDTQLRDKASYIISNSEVHGLYKSISSESFDNSFGITNYYVQIRDSKGYILKTPVSPKGRDILSTPKLPESGRIDLSVIDTPYTAESDVVKLSENIPEQQAEEASQPWRVLMVKVENYDKDDYYVYVGMSLADMDSNIHAITMYMQIVGLCLLVIAGIWGSIAIGCTLNPLKQIEKTAAKIAAGDLSKRVRRMPENTEIGSLSASLNTMLSHIEHSFREQQQTTGQMKRFVSDASHELRTPLAAIQGYAELYRMQREYPGALERADETIEHIEKSSLRMTALVNDLLSLARLDEGHGLNLTQFVRLDSLLLECSDDMHALDPDRIIVVSGVMLIDKPHDDKMPDMKELAGENGATGYVGTRYGVVDATQIVEAAEVSMNSDKDFDESKDKPENVEFVTYDGRQNEQTKKKEEVRSASLAQLVKNTSEEHVQSKRQMRKQKRAEVKRVKKELKRIRKKRRKGVLSSESKRTVQSYFNPVDIGKVYRPESREMIAAGLMREQCFAVNPYLPLPEVFVAGDASRLRQVVTNIIGNIHRYTPEFSDVELGIATVKASCKKDLAALPSNSRSLEDFIQDVQIAEVNEKGDEYAVIVISDHGSGLSEEDREKVFERFYTADPSRAREKGGSGLGMSIVQSIVKAHHGLISAQRTIGGGLTYVIVLPLKQHKHEKDKKFIMKETAEESKHFE